MTATVVTPPASANDSQFARVAGRLVRGGAALGLAATITFGLFTLMQSLIASNATPPAPQAEPPTVTISVMPPEIAPPRGGRDFDVEPVTPPPPSPRVRIDLQAQPSSTGLTVAPPVINTQQIVDGIETIAPAPPPLDVRVEPAYPRAELSRGVQGDCTVRYDILASGVTANLSVMSCDSRGFERSSLEAVAQWRHAAYRDQAPDEVVRRGVMTTLSYRLQE